MCVCIYKFNFCIFLFIIIYIYIYKHTIVLLCITCWCIANNSKLTIVYLIVFSITMFVSIPPRPPLLQRPYLLHVVRYTMWSGLYAVVSTSWIRLTKPDHIVDLTTCNKLGRRNRGDGGYAHPILKSRGPPMYWTLPHFYLAIYFDWLLPRHT